MKIYNLWVLVVVLVCAARVYGAYRLLNRAVPTPTSVKTASPTSCPVCKVTTCPSCPATKAPTTCPTTPTPKVTSTYPNRTAIVIPSALDWRNDPCMPPIKNQGKCIGGDWAFAATTPLEFTHCKNHNGKLTLFSEQQLLDCDKSDNGCLWGYSWHAFSYYLQPFGHPSLLSSAASYPLTSDKTGSFGTCKQGDGMVNIVASGFVSSTFPFNRSPPTVMINKLNQFGPLAVEMTVTDNVFNSYTGGIYNDFYCGSSAIAYRLLVIVGYGHDPSSGSDYWIVRGSFGTKWGMNGYMYVKRGVNYCNIEYWPLFAVAD